MRKRKSSIGLGTIATLAFGLQFIFGVLTVAVWCGLAYVAYHFISKFW